MMKNPKETKNNWIRLWSCMGFVFAVLLAAFIVLQFRSAWQGPVITVEYPLKGQTVHDPIILIQGTTRNIAQLEVFGSSVPIQLKTNTFVTELALPEGVSNIVLDGYTRAGRHTRTTIPITYVIPQPGQPLAPELQILQKFGPTETPFRPSSDILDEVQ